MSGTSVEVFDLLQRLWRQRQILALWGFICGAAALGAMQLFPQRYSSEGLLLIENREPQILDIGSSAASTPPPNNRDHTVADVLRSRSLMGDVVHALNLTKDSGIDAGVRLPPTIAPIWASVYKSMRTIAERVGLIPTEASQNRASDAEADDAVEYLQKHFKIDMTEGSRLVSLTFEATNPLLAANVVNSLMDRYIASDIQQKREMMTQANHWLSERVVELRKEVDAADRQVQDFRREHNLVHVEAGSLQAVQLAADQAQLSFARAEYSKLSSALSTMQDQVRSGATGTSSQEVLASPVIQALRQRETDLYQRLDLSTQRLGSVNIDRQAVEEELRTVHRRIAAETQAILVSLTRDVAVARDRVAALEQRVAVSGALAGETADAEVTLAGLQRDADVKRQTYNSFVVRADQTQFASSQFPSVRILSRAVPAPRAESPHTIQIVLFAIVGGITLGAAVLLLRKRLDSKIRSVVDLAIATGLPVLGSIPMIKRSMEVAVLEEEGSLLAETLRAFRINISWKAVAGRGTTVLVTSSTIGEGKTTIAASLARRLAADGIKVLLIDADLRRPRLKTLLDLSADRSIEKVIADGLPVEDAVQIDKRSGLHCLVASGRTSNPLGLLTSDAFSAMITKVRETYQVIILDSPPVLRVADPILLSRWIDMTLFIVRSNLTTIALVSEALRRLPEAQRSNITLALNQVRRRQADPRDFYSGYGEPVRAVAVSRSSE